MTGKRTALITGCIILILTMVLHPAGGNIRYLQKISSVIIISHSLALLAMPLMIYGFWGISRSLDRFTFLSRFAFICSCISIIAGICAAALNGLALPLFINRYKTISDAELVIVKTLIAYNISLNHAFDYILIIGLSISICLWSIGIVIAGIYPRWIGYIGIILSFILLAGILTGFTFVGLTGFRIFIFGIVIWIVSIGIFPEKVKV